MIPRLAAGETKVSDMRGGESARGGDTIRGLHEDRLNVVYRRTASGMQAELVGGDDFIRQLMAHG